jgi:hypothetical protein
MTTSTTDSIHLTDLTDLTQKTQKNKGGRPSNSIWEDINKGKSIGSGKFAASCKYCDNTWPHGEVSKLEEHLSNHCPGAPADVVRKYMSKVIERQDKKPSKKRKHSEVGQQSIRSYHDSTEIPDSRITRINRALVKFFIACGMSFRIVEHPFFINFVKELNAGYDPPSRECLAGQLLERELGKLVDFSHDLITEGIEIPRDIQDDLDESDKEGDRSIIDNNVNDGRSGRGDFNYSIEDFLVEEEEEDKEDNEQQ